MTLALDLTDRPCLVVGGAGGRIGSAIAAAVADAGAPVGVITHNADHAVAAAAELRSRGGAVVTAVVDVGVEADLVDAIARIADELGPLRHLVNVIGGAAGEYHAGDSMSLDAIDRVRDRNFTYAVVTCREVGARLLAAGLTGSMVNISSAAAIGRPMLGAYSAAKAALDAYTRTLALEWAPAGIRVNVLAAGATRTGDQPRGEEIASIPLRRKGEPDEIAAATLFLLSDLASYTTGATLHVDGGANLGHPGGAARSPLAESRPARSEPGPAGTTPAGTRHTPSSEHTSSEGNTT